MSADSHVFLIGMGCGNLSTLTLEGQKHLENSDLIIGADRLLKSLPSDYSGNCISLYKSKDILHTVLNSSCESISVVFSGDTGFYSGTKTLIPLLKEYKIDFKIIPGISSVQLLAARLSRPWQDWKLCSAHGIDCDAVLEVMERKPVFFLTGGTHSPASLCSQLCSAGLGEIEVTIGENLSYPNEHIYFGKAQDFIGKKFSSLSVMLTEALTPEFKPRSSGFSDEMFIRGNIPMTKQEIRSAILAKLGITPTDIVWDVGAGTGSVSVELALAANKGKCYGIECSHEGIELIIANKNKFSAWNLNVIEGNAPEALLDLPSPDAVFIGGTKGKLREIINTALSKNPNVRICISAIALETLSSALNILTENNLDFEVTQISVNRSKPTGNLHLMMANNPVYLITAHKGDFPL